MTRRHQPATRALPGRRTGFSLYPLWQWLVVVPVIVVATAVGATIAIILSLLVSPKIANRVIAEPWCRLVARITPVRLEITGREHVDPHRSYVVVANHQSQYDIPVIYGFSGLDLRWVMKAELGKVPFIAQGCRAIGHIFVDRADPEQSRSAINQAVARMPGGTGIVFFAEGTRSRDGALLPFKKGAFRVAIDRQMPILPITVWGTREILPSGSLSIRPGKARMVLHAPVETTGLGDADLRPLRDRVHRIIEQGLESPG